jgi:hypothetical protein
VTPALRFPAIALLLASGAAVFGCGNGDDPNRYTKLDDMEGAINQIAWPPPDGAMPGLWFSSADCTQADRISPTPYFVDPDAAVYAELPAHHETFPGVASTHAVRLRTTAPLVGVWGGNIAVGFASTGRPSLPPTPANGAPCRQGTDTDFPSPTVDLTAYAGITFWAKAESGARNLRVQLNDRNTDPRGGVCNAPDPYDESRCYNGFGTSIVLTPTFQRYTIDFSVLAQNLLWGFRPDPGVPDLGHVYSMNFQFDAADCMTSEASMCAGGASPPLSFDLWLDDLYFVNR